MSLKDDAWLDRFGKGSLVALETAVLGVVVGRKPDCSGKRVSAWGREGSNIALYLEEAEEAAEN